LTHVDSLSHDALRETEKKVSLLLGRERQSYLSWFIVSLACSESARDTLSYSTVKGSYSPSEKPQAIESCEFCSPTTSRPIIGRLYNITECMGLYFKVRLVVELVFSEVTRVFII